MSTYQECLQGIETQVAAMSKWKRRVNRVGALQFQVEWLDNPPFLNTFRTFLQVCTACHTSISLILPVLVESLKNNWVILDDDTENSLRRTSRVVNEMILRLADLLKIHHSALEYPGKLRVKGEVAAEMITAEELTSLFTAYETEFKHLAAEYQRLSDADAAADPNNKFIHLMQTSA